jgi:hypothetical protein
MASSTYHGFATDAEYYRSLGVSNSNFENENENENNMYGPTAEELNTYYKDLEDEILQNAEKKEYVEIHPFTMKKDQFYSIFSMGTIRPILFKGFKKNKLTDETEIVFLQYLPSCNLDTILDTIPIKNTRILQKKEAIFRKHYETTTGQSGQPGHGPANTILQYANLMKPYPKSRKSRKSRVQRKTRNQRKSRTQRKRRKSRRINKTK